MVNYATGWGRWTVDLLDEISRMGVEPVLVLPPSQREAHAALGLKRFESHFWGPEPYLQFHTLRSLNLRGLWDLATVRRKEAQLRGIDLIHAADLYPWGYFGMQMKARLCAPLLVTNHSKLLFNPRRSPLDGWLCRRALRDADRVCSVSAWGREQILLAYPSLARERLRVIHNGVNPALFLTHAGDAARSSRRGGPLLLSVTRFIRLKSIETTVLAFAEVKRALPQAELRIVGPHTVTAYVREIRRLIFEKGLKDVQLPGKTTDLAELCEHYAAADLLVHTSASESYPLIFLEAGCFGLPIVATRVGGVPDVIVDGENGLLVEKGDHRAIAAAVLRIASDPALAARLGEGGRKRAAHQTTAKVAQDYLYLYRELLGART
jgi:starch synthase